MKTQIPARSAVHQLAPPKPPLEGSSPAPARRPSRLLLLFRFTLLALVAWTSSFQARAQFIWIDLSYKVVRDPATGLRPPGVTDAQIDQAVTRMNQLEADYWRGYRFRRVDPVTEIGDTNDPAGPSRWYNTDFFDPSNGNAWKDEMEEAARSDARYAWNNQAINLYLTHHICGGKCSFPNDQIVIIGDCSAGAGDIHLHEIGHYFDLFHTQGRTCGNCDPNQTGECHTQPGDDEIADTLPDLQCWGPNDIAINQFGVLYNNLTAAQQQQVDDVFFNIMSYHQGLSRLTELQLDKWTHTANDSRPVVRSGETRFVGAGETHASVADGGNAANPAGGDIVLIRPGAYNEILTISKPLTLRATRAGLVAIGTSVTP